MIELGQFLFGEAPSVDIASDQWDSFVADFAIPILLLVVAGVALSVWWYRRCARLRMIRTATDVFLPYTPMRKPLWVSIGVATASALSLLLVYHFRFAVWEGMLQTGARAAFWTGIPVCLVSYLVIISYKPLTPSKFRYRPHFWLRSAKKATS